MKITNQQNLNQEKFRVRLKGSRDYTVLDTHLPSSFLILILVPSTTSNKIQTIL
jgi:hypothetical protein